MNTIDIDNATPLPGVNCIALHGVASPTHEAGRPGEAILVKVDNKTYKVAHIVYLLQSRFSDLPSFVFSKFAVVDVHDPASFKTWHEDTYFPISSNSLIWIMGYKFV